MAEREIKIHQKLSPPEDFQDYITDTQNEVNQMAESIGVEPVKIFRPQHGFLKHSLTEKERKRLDDQLSLIYAKRSVDFQKGAEIVSINESHERMVSLPDLFTQENVPVHFSEKPFHKACGVDDEGNARPREYWVRDQVAQRLVVAVKALNTIGLSLQFEDGYRPKGVYEGLFKRRITDFILPNHHDWSYDQILLEARSKTAFNPIVAGHKGGAAVDATLYRLDDNSALDLGNKYPEGGAMVALDFPYLTKEQWRTRQLFSAVMKMAGLTPYEGEDWHASFGDNLAAHGDNYVAQYGPIKGFNPKTGEVDPYDPSEYSTPFYTEEELRSIINEATFMSTSSSERRTKQSDDIIPPFTELPK